MLQKLSIKTGLTKTEIRVIVFLGITLIVGFCYSIFFKSPDNSSIKKFDYTGQDSLFLASGSNEDSTGFTDAFTLNEKSSSANLLELNNKEYPRLQSKKLPVGKSINLNSANEVLLITLPGIGIKTAQKILGLRRKLGKFKNYDDLLEVKGIGNTKLEKIKKYSYIK